MLQLISLAQCRELYQRQCIAMATMLCTTEMLWIPAQLVALLATLAPVTRMSPLPGPNALLRGSPLPCMSLRVNRVPLVPPPLLNHRCTEQPSLGYVPP